MTRLTGDCGKYPGKGPLWRAVLVALGKKVCNFFENVFMMLKYEPREPKSEFETPSAAVC